LVDGLNDYVGDPGRYAAVADPAAGTGTDAIKVALIYQPDAVTPVGASHPSVRATTAPGGRQRELRARPLRL